LYSFDTGDGWLEIGLTYRSLSSRVVSRLAAPILHTGMAEFPRPNREFFMMDVFAISPVSYRAA
jgi:hypothetical protein